MRFSKYILCLFMATFLSVVYTHQQFLLIKTNYSINNHKAQLSQLLDRNMKLMYNVAALESPANLEAKLMACGMDYAVPGRWIVVKGMKSEPKYEFAKLARRRNIVLEKILNFIAVRAEAKAIED